ncbi:hypothetical protein KUCAC02_032843 [Chaenocephalus aceratus]|nr:hypothetical protein KUCAC02_032843 [Chaenocephalus aceratus]
MTVLQILAVSVVGVVRELAPFVKYVQYCLDDMTGPPLTDCTPLVFASPGSYVKVIGSLRSSTGERFFKRNLM